MSLNERVGFICTLFVLKRKFFFCSRKSDKTTHRVLQSFRGRRVAEPGTYNHSQIRMDRDGGAFSCGVSGYGFRAPLRGPE